MHLSPLVVSTAALLLASTSPDAHSVSAAALVNAPPSHQLPFLAPSDVASASTTTYISDTHAQPHKAHALFRLSSHHPSLIAQLSKRIQAAQQQQQQQQQQQGNPVTGASPAWDVWRHSSGPSCALPGHSTSAQKDPTPRLACLDVQSSLSGPEGCQALLSILDPSARSEVSCDVLQSDVGALVVQQLHDRVKQLAEDEQKVRAAKQHGGRSKKGGSKKGPIQRVELEDDEFHNVYHPLNEIEAHLDELASLYPDLLELIEIGRTHEDRPIRVAKVSRKHEDGEDLRKRIRKHPRGKPSRQGESEDEEDEEPEAKMGVLITGGMHAREWIGASVSLYFLSHLLSATSQSDPRVLSILDDFDISLLPVANPDGYAYTWETDRMWRKNRQQNEGWLGSRCPGIDLNRGFPFHWEHTSNPCSESFAGPSPLSSLENQAIASYISSWTSNNASLSSSSSSSSSRTHTSTPTSRIGAYIDLHSYGQQLLYPFSYSCLDSPADEEDLVEVGIGAANALRKVHRKSFEVGKTCETLYPSSGSSIDYAYSAGAKWSFSIELRDQGSFGFLLPQDAIRPSGEETTVGLLYLLEFVAKEESNRR